MPRWLLILMLLAAFPASAQQFIGCRTDNGWAETPMLRKTFKLRASDLKCYDFQTLDFTLSVVSLGYHEVYVNRQHVGDHVMQPAVSQLDKRAWRLDYDITEFLHEGENEILLWIGQGWGRVYGTPAVVQAELIREVGDGECGEVDVFALTNKTWKASPSGYSYTGSWQPLQFGGERYDARVQPVWRPAEVYDAKDINISRQEFKGNRIVDTIAPVTWTCFDRASILFDFGRVVTGWLQLDFPPMPEGTEMIIKYLDHLDAKPSCIEKDIYVARGGSKEHFTNRFHSHSFRYVSIQTVDPDLQITNIKAQALQISAVDPKEGATFECSDPRLNAIHDMVKYTLSCLTFSGYMVDCPHLERMGYGGDGNSSTQTLQTFWDVRDTYRNWLTAWADAMDSTGSLPYVAPAFPTGGGPYWSGFIVKAPWRTYLNYGDISFVRSYYLSMKHWLDYVASYSPSGLLQRWPDQGRMWFLGDWLAPKDVNGEPLQLLDGDSSALFVSNCFIAECLSDMEQMARLLGRTDDCRQFITRRMLLVENIHRTFYHPETHTYAKGTPIDQCYALLQGIPPDSATAQAVREQLLADCHGKYNDHIAVGLMGIPLFTEWCIRERQTDLMATLLRQPDYPGYLYMIQNDATTTWESWDGDRSRVHNCYNGIGIWFYQALAGICPDPKKPGYKHFFIDPQPVSGVDWLKATKPTLFGTIRVEISGGDLKLEVPPGTTATVFPGTPYEYTVKSGEWKFKCFLSE